MMNICKNLLFLISITINTVDNSINTVNNTIVESSMTDIQLTEYKNEMINIVNSHQKINGFYKILESKNFNDIINAYEKETICENDLTHLNNALNEINNIFPNENVLFNQLSKNLFGLDLVMTLTGHDYTQNISIRKEVLQEYHNEKIENPSLSLEKFIIDFINKDKMYSIYYYKSLVFNYEQQQKQKQQNSNIK